MRPLLKTLGAVALALLYLGASGCDISNLPPPPPKDKAFCNVTAVPCATFKYKQCCVSGTCVDFCTPSGFDPVCFDNSDCVLPIGCSGVICGGFLQDPASVTNPALCPTIPASAPGAGDTVCFQHAMETPQDACADMCAVFGGGLNSINWPTAGNLRSRCSAALNTDPAYHSGLVDGYVPNGCVDPTPPPFPLASQGTHAVTLAGSGTVSLEDAGTTAVSVIGGFFDIAAPFTTCTALQATCPTQINQVEVRFADFTLDDHSIQGLTLKLDEQVLTASGVQSGSFFIFTIPQAVTFDAIAAVDGHLTGLIVTSTQQVEGSINLATGSLAFQFDLTGTFNGKTLEATGVATSASVVALAPVVTAGPVTVVDSPESCTADVTLTASATSAAGLPVALTYIVDDQVVGSGASATTTMAIGTAHDVTITGTDSNGMQDTATETVTPTDTLGPVVTTVPSRITLWPPNHGYATVSLDQCVTSVVDQCGGLLSPVAQGQITSVTSNEPAVDPPSDTTCNDMVIVNNYTVKLRAERDEEGQGRLYTIHFTESDPDGNATQATCIVQVTHDQSGPPAPDTAPVTCVGTSCGGVPPPSC